MSKPTAEDLARLERCRSIPLRLLRFDEEWRERAREARRAHGYAQKHLGDALGIAQSGLSHLLGHGQRQSVAESEYVERLSAALEIELPVTAQVQLAVNGLLERGESDAIRSALVSLQALWEQAENRAKERRRK